MKKISRIEYCAGFEPLQSGMEQDEGSRILPLAMDRIREEEENRKALMDEFDNDEDNFDSDDLDSDNFSSDDFGSDDFGSDDF